MSVLMVIDCVRAWSHKTHQTVGVCRMRNLGDCFINKLDREGQNPFDLLDRIKKN